jgi:hypothetical protein
MAYVIRILVSFPASLWMGYVVSILWGWYVEPLGAPHLSVVRAIGVAMTIALMKSPRLPTHKESGKEWSPGQQTLMAIFVWGLGPAIALLVGWFWKHWL